MTTDLDLPTTSTPSPIDPGSPEGIAWFDATLRQAEYLAASEIVPESYRGRAPDIVVAAMYGRDFGWSPTMAMSNIHVVKGKPTLSAQAMVALVRGAGHSISGEASSESATVSGCRSDTGDDMTVTFSTEDAKRAGLTTEPWRKYPQSMCWARAVSSLCRMLFADVLMGVSYTPEELDGIPDVDPVEPAAIDARSEDDLERDRLLSQLQDLIGKLEPQEALDWQTFKDHNPAWFKSSAGVRSSIEHVTGLLAAAGAEPFATDGEATATSGASVPGAGEANTDGVSTADVAAVESAPVDLTNTGENDTRKVSDSQSVPAGVVRETELVQPSASVTHSGAVSGVDGPGTATTNPVTEARKAATR